MSAFAAKLETLSPAARLALSDALAKRGPNKGRFLASAPRSGTLANAAWMGAMLSCNPYKASIPALMFMDAAASAICREVESFFDSFPVRIRVQFDRDAAALSALGVF